MSLSIGQKVMFGRPNGEKTEGVVEKINAKSVKVRQTEARGGHPVGTIWTVGPSLITPISGSATTPATKPTVPGVVRDLIAANWNQLAPRFGLPTDAVGKTFKAKGTEYRITGINPSRPKFPVDCIRTRDNRPFKFTAQGIIDGLKATTAPTAPRVPLASGLNVGSTVNYQGYQWASAKTGPAPATVTGVITAINHRDQTVEVFCGTDTRKYKTLPFADVTPAPKRDPKVILADFASVHMLLEPENLTCDGERSRSECNRIAAILQRALRALAIENGRMVDSSEAFRLSDDANVVS